MTYVRRKTFKRKPKDILDIALRNLFQGEELLCTARTFGNIKGRVESFNCSHQDKRMGVIPSMGIRIIRRVA
jgi:hypothetical protein